MWFSAQICVFTSRSASQTLISLILWHPRKPASPISATEGQSHLHPPPPLTAVRTRAAPALNARPYPPTSPQAPPPIFPSRPTLLHPLTSSPARPLIPTHPAPRRAVAPRTCPWTRVPPAETRHLAPLPLIGTRRTVIGILSPSLSPDQPPLPALLLLLLFSLLLLLLLSPHSQLPPLSSPAPLCPAVPTRNIKRNPRSTKTRIERGRKGNGRKVAAEVLPTWQSRPKRLVESKRDAVLRKRVEKLSIRILTKLKVCFSQIYYQHYWSTTFWNLIDHTRVFMGHTHTHTHTSSYHQMLSTSFTSLKTSFL